MVDCSIKLIFCCFCCSNWGGANKRYQRWDVWFAVRLWNSHEERGGGM